MAKFLCGLYIAVVLALYAGAVATWQLRCEGFGCMGIGVAWMAWALGFGLVLGVGALARVKARSSRPLTRMTRVVWWGQWLLGLALAGLWLAKQLA